MYGVNPNGGAPTLHRDLEPVERTTKCTVCGMKPGFACVVRGESEDGEHAGHPHNKRYLAAGIDPYSEQPRAAAP